MICRNQTIWPLLDYLSKSSPTSFGVVSIGGGGFFSLVYTRKCCCPKALYYWCVNKRDTNNHLAAPYLIYLELVLNSPNKTETAIFKPFNFCSFFFFLQGHITLRTLLLSRYVGFSVVGFGILFLLFFVWKSSLASRCLYCTGTCTNDDVNNFVL